MMPLFTTRENITLPHPGAPGDSAVTCFQPVVVQRLYRTHDAGRSGIEDITVLPECAYQGTYGCQELFGG